MEDKFKALGHENRLKLYRAVAGEPLCVCELTELLDISQSAVSQHVSKLRNAGLVESDRRGQWTFYRPAEGSFREPLNELIGEPFEDLWEELNRIKGEDLCDIRDEDGELPE